HAGADDLAVDHGGVEAEMLAGPRTLQGVAHRVQQRQMVDRGRTRATDREPDAVQQLGHRQGEQIVELGADQPERVLSGRELRPQGLRFDFQEVDQSRIAPDEVEKEGVVDDADAKTWWLKQHATSPVMRACDTGMRYGPAMRAS